MVPNQNPKQIARNSIDEILMASGWRVHDNKNVYLNERTGQAIREYQTDVEPAGLVLLSYWR